MRFYYLDKNREDPMLDKYIMEEDFLIMFDNFMEDIFKPPKYGEKVATVPYESPKMEREKLIQFLDNLPASNHSKPQERSGHSLFSRLKKKLTAWASM